MIDLLSHGTSTIEGVNCTTLCAGGSTPKQLIACYSTQD
jgi:hypothetical protein